MSKKLFRSIILLILLAAFSGLIVWKIDSVLDIIKTITSVLSPLVVGFVIAFILNKPFEGILKLCGVVGLQGGRRGEKAPENRLIKPMALAITYILFFGIIVSVFVVLVPQLAVSVETLVENRNVYTQNLRDLYTWATRQLNLTTGITEAEVELYLQTLFDNAMNYAKNMAPLIFSFTQGVVRAFTNFFVGLFISAYFLYDKNHLISQLKRLLFSYIPTKVTEAVIHVGKVANETFSNFVTGQLLEAFILGILCFVCLFILRYPYAVLISVIIGISNLIPIAGPILGTLPGMLILLMGNPMQAVWFVVISVLLQQVDGKIIYPKVVGSSVGLPALWVLIAITVGGGLFGLMGMIVAVPSFSVLYKLVKENSEKQLEKKQIEPCQYQ